MSNKLKIIIYIILGVIVVAATIYFIFFYKATIIINPDPQSAQVEIAGHSQIGPMQLKLNPGEYKLKISLPNYVTFERTIQLKMSQTLNLDIKLKTQPEALKLVDYPAKFTTLTADKKSLLYISDEGKTAYIIHHINSEVVSKHSTITPPVFGEVNEMIWHPDKRLAILKKNNEHTAIYDFGRYDLVNQEEKDWGKGIGDVAFDDNGNKIIYFYAPDTGERTLIRANKDNSNMERLIDLREYNLQNPKIRWSPDNKYALLITDQIFVVNMYYKSINQLTQFSSISNADFTPDSQNIIYEQNGKLSLIDLKGENQKELEINTLLKKTVWMNNNTLFYAYREADQSSDNVANISIDSLEKNQYDYNRDQPINILNPILSLDKNKIFFESNDYVYRLELVGKEYE